MLRSPQFGKPRRVFSQGAAQREQLLAQLNSSQRRISQMDANLRRAADILDKFSAYSPINGVVTNLPVRVGETMVTGIQNSPGSTLMTIADMSVITAEVRWTRPTSSTSAWIRLPTSLLMPFPGVLSRARDRDR